MKKQALVYKDYDVYVFNPLRNRFDSTTRTHSRPMTIAEQKIKKQDIFWTSFNAIYCVLVTFLTILAVVSICICGNTRFFPWILGAISAGAWTLFVKVFDVAETKLDIQVAHFSDTGFEIPDLIWEQECEEQERLAKEWREQHRLEESIRIAQETYNCVDIAQAAKIYAEYYINNKGE
jgi:hypothetical protein